MNEVPDRQLQRGKPWGRKMEMGAEGAVHEAPPPEVQTLSSKPSAPADPFKVTLPPFLEKNAYMQQGFLKVATFVKARRSEGLREPEAYEAAVKMVARFPELEAARQGRKTARIPKGLTAGMEIALMHYKVYADQVS